MTEPSGKSPAGLERFLSAQNGADSGFESALAEIRSGGKRGHWIWYVFPQLSGLGASAASEFFGVRGEEEAAAFLRDAELRSRLLVITTAVADQLRTRRGMSLRALMGSDTDVRKLVSSLTLFGSVARALYASEGLESCDSIAATAVEVLSIAASEGYPRCAYTLRQLSPGT